MPRENTPMTAAVAALRVAPLLHLILPTIVVMMIVVGATAVYVPGIMETTTIESARHSNVEIADLIKTTRGYYTRQVVAKVLQSNSMIPSYDHANDPKAIPLPATFVKDISDILQKKDIT